MLSEEVLLCPKCKEKLERKNQSFLCPNNHCYDISKNNYVNLLLCNQKKSKAPGDDKLMIVARNEFLENGYFEILRKNVEDIVRSQKPSVILDAGCGTGYYTHNLQNEFNVIAMDISKEAVRCTSKNNKKTLAVVSSIFDLPLKNNSIDLILNIFAPKPQEEFHRVLTETGIIIEVVPGKEHLKELKEKIFDSSNIPNKEKFAYNNFSLKESEHLKYVVNIKSSEDLIDLLKMTPYYYKGGYHQMTKLGMTNNLEVTFDFILNIWNH